MVKITPHKNNTKTTSDDSKRSNNPTSKTEQNNPQTCNIEYMKMAEHYVLLLKR